MARVHTLKSFFRVTALVMVSVTLFVILRRLAITSDLTESKWMSTVHNEPPTKRVDRDEVEATDKTYSPCIRRVDIDTVHVTIMADNKSMIGMMALANSIVQNTESDVMFHFVTVPSDAAVLRRWINGSILRSVSHEVIELPREKLKDKFVVRSPRKDLACEMNFARILLPDLLPCVGRVIFIDADCLVLGDIRELYDFKMAANYVVAGVNMCDFKNISKFSTIGLILNYSLAQVQQLAIPKDACMMNAGMFLADLRLWEKHNISQHLQFWMELNTRETVIRYSDLGTGSQAVLNIVLYDKYSSVPKEWNTLNGFHSTVQHPKLLHWNGKIKPWLKSAGLYISEWKKYTCPTLTNALSPATEGMERGNHPRIPISVEGSINDFLFAN